MAERKIRRRIRNSATAEKNLGTAPSRTGIGAASDDEAGAMGSELSPRWGTHALGRRDARVGDAVAGGCL